MGLKFEVVESTNTKDFEEMIENRLQEGFAIVRSGCVMLNMPNGGFISQHWAHLIKGEV